MRRVFPFVKAVSFLAIPAAIWWIATEVRPVAAQNTPWAGFDYFHEFYGPNGYSDPQVAMHFEQGMMNGLSFTPPVTAGVGRIASPYNAGLMLRLHGAAQPAGITEEALETQRLALQSLNGQKLLWDLMPEWDQSGGAWVAQGRPRYNGLTRTAARDRFLNYYRTSFPSLIRYLSAPRDSRNYLLAAVTDYSPNVFDAYELGVEVQFLERGLDELGDLSTGLAYIRGAANQYGRPWGIDIASWRTGNGKATNYDTNGRLLGGWSASYLRRLTYMSFFAGANLIHNEAAIYRDARGNLNPFGTATQEFAEFALRRHPELGKPLVTTALMVDANFGFDTKHGPFNQRDAVWYQDIAYSDGDRMMNQFFRLGYPNHWLHGLAPGAPFANAAGVPDAIGFQNYLAAGGDARPYEVAPFTRWGDQIDILTNRTGAEPLQRYKMIILMGDITLDARMRRVLTDWVAAGGTLVMNAAQATANDQELAGLTFDKAVTRTARFSRWTPDDEGRSEPPYSYTPVRVQNAEVWAVNETGDPLVTSHTIGYGQVVFTTPLYLQPSTRDSLLSIGVQLIDWLFDRDAIVRVQGPEIAYSVNVAPGKTVVALFNSTGNNWTGKIKMTLPAAPLRAVEYVSDQQIPHAVEGGVVNVQAVVPAYDLKVIAVEYSTESDPKFRIRKHATRPSQN